MTLSEFIRAATTQEKESVYQRVMEKVAASQAAVLASPRWTCGVHGMGKGAFCPFCSVPNYRQR